MTKQQLAAEVTQSTLTSKEIKQLNKLTKKWEDSKSELQAAQAKELDLRVKVNSLLAKRNLNDIKIATEEKVITFKRNKNYSIPKVGVQAIKTTIDNTTTFDKLFTTTYKLKTAAYNLLEEKSKIKAVIDTHLTVKDAPLSVTAKEVE